MTMRAAERGAREREGSRYLLGLPGAAFHPLLQFAQLLLRHGAVGLRVALPSLRRLLLLPCSMVALLGSLNLARTATNVDPATPSPAPPPAQVGFRKGPILPQLTSFSLLSQGFWALRKPSSAARLSRKPPSTGRWKAPRCQARTRSLSWPCSFSRTSRCSALSLSAAVKKACQAFSSVPYWGPAGRGGGAGTRPGTQPETSLPSSPPHPKVLPWGPGPVGGV